MNIFSVICVLTILLLNIGLSQCAKILAVFPSPGYSQFILAEPLIRALAERGHQVTLISEFQVKNASNVRHIAIQRNDKENDISDQCFVLQNQNIFQIIMFIHEFALNMTEEVLASTGVQDLIRSNEKFDLLLIETFYDEALQALAKHFNAHQVLFHTMALNEWNSHLVANPMLPSFMPQSFIGYTTRMTFLQRLKNTAAIWFDRIYEQFINRPAHQKLVDKYFPEKYNLNKFIYNASLMLTCSHVSTSDPIPITTSVIEVGGLHIVNKKLPDNIKKFLDSAENGAIFFSMGSNLKSSKMPKEIIQGIMTVIGKLKQKVLWKFEDNESFDKPENLMISEWFPQSDILAHPNTILFISHCGMGGTTEAIYNGVPVLGMPVFADQVNNLRRLEFYGMGLELPLQKLSAKLLQDSINEMLSNPKYRNNAKKRSSIMKDRPVKPLDLAVYWVEYVLRHDGAPYLKNSIFDLEWYQLYLLDVIGLMIVMVFSVTIIIFVGLRLLCRRIVSKQKTE